MDLNEILPKLRSKFLPDAHKERVLPGGGKWFFIPWQAIRERFDEVCPGLWEVSYSTPTYVGDYCTITCTISILGISRQGIGSAEIVQLSGSGRDMSRGNPIERATADAFKNAAEAWGVARYLDDQADDRTKREFASYMQRSGNGKVAVEYRKQAGLQSESKPKPNQSKPFGRSPSPSPTPATPAPATAHPANPEAISDAQRKRFWAIATKTGFTEGGIKRLIEAWGFTSTKEITKNAYEGLCAKAEDPEMMEIYNSMAKALEAEAS